MMGEHSFGMHLFFTLINFSILIIALILIGRKRLSEGIRERGREIKKEMEEREEERKRLKVVKDEYLMKLENIEREIEELKRRAISEMERDAEEKKKKIIEQSRRFEEAVQRLIMNEYETVISSVRGEIADMALDIAKRLVKERMKEEDEIRMREEAFSLLKRQ